MRRLLLPLFIIAGGGAACSTLIGADFNDRTLSGTTTGGTGGGSTSAGATGGGGTGGGTGGSSLCNASPHGAIEWLTPIGVLIGTFPEKGSVAVLPNGDIVVFGSFTGVQLSAGSEELPVGGAEAQNMYIARIGPQGNVLNLKQFGGKGAQTARGIATDPKDPKLVYFWGDFEGGFTFEQANAKASDSSVLFAIPPGDIFAPDLFTPRAASKITTGDAPMRLGVTVDDGRVFSSLGFTDPLEGWFGKTLGDALGDWAFTMSGMKSLDGSSSNANPKGCKLGMSSTWEPGPIAIDHSGKLLVTGIFSGPPCQPVLSLPDSSGLLILHYLADLTSPPTPFSAHPGSGDLAANHVGGVAASKSQSWIVSNSGTQVFIDRFTDKVETATASYLNGATDVRATSLATDPGKDDSLFVTADFSGTLTDSVTQAGGLAHNGVLMKLDPGNGHILWSTAVRSNSNEVHMDSVTLGPAGQIIVTGRYKGADDLPQFVPSTIPAGSEFAFVASICP